jgi:hypothetical protein
MPPSLKHISDDTKEGIIEPLVHRISTKSDTGRVITDPENIGAVRSYV